MTLQQAIEILEQFNLWRRGEETPQPDPKIIGEAIDIAIHQLKQLK